MALISLFACRIEAQRVVARDGDIVVTDRMGHEHRLTDLGRDHDPSLSPDGELVVFVRWTGETVGSRLRSEQERITELWIADVSGSKPPERLLSAPVNVNAREFYEFSSPQLAPGDNDVYFLVSYAPTTWGIVRFSSADHSARFIALALEFQIVTKGDFSGDLIVQQRRPYAGGGFYDWYWLLFPDGREIGLVGPNQESVKGFLSDTAH